jgi:putative phage-type endonuclease
MIILDCEQRSEEWYDARRARITASQADNLLTPAKRLTLAKDILVESISDTVAPMFVNEAMQWGIDEEHRARTWYELETGKTVTEVGFCLHDKIKYIGCSPDGLVDDGLLEIKCPNSRTHLDYLENGAPKNYIAQMQFQMWVTDRGWCDFVSYDSRLPGNAQILIQRIERDEKMIELLKENAAWVNEYIVSFKKKYGIL